MYLNPHLNETVLSLSFWHVFGKCNKMLNVQAISKTYTGGIKALDNIDLSIGQGVFGLLGPNGAGKSSLMRTMATLQRPDSGSMQLDGLDIIASPLEARKLIGYLPQDMGVYPRVTAFEMLDYLAGLKGLERQGRQAKIEAQLEHVNLQDVAHQRLDTYSGGMRRRFGIAAAFIGDPKLVIVDEPTAGLDPSERRRFQFLLAEAAKRCVLILSSHIVEDLAGLCSNMALMNKGRIICQGAPQDLTSDLNGKVWSKPIDFSELKSMQDNYRVLSWRPHQGGLAIRVFSEDSPGEGFTAESADLEDLYSVNIGGEVA